MEMIGPIDSRVNKLNYHKACANIDILATQALFVMEFFKIICSHDKRKLLSFLNYFKSHSITENLPPNFNIDLIEPYCRLIYTGKLCHRGKQWQLGERWMRKPSVQGGK